MQEESGDIASWVPSIIGAYNRKGSLHCYGHLSPAPAVRPPKGMVYTVYNYSTYAAPVAPMRISPETMTANPNIMMYLLLCTDN